MKVVSKLATAASVTALVAASAGAVAAKDLIITHFQAGEIDSPAHAASLAFESCVEGKTSGGIDVQVFPAGQLGNATEVLESMQLGTVQMGIVHDGAIPTVYKPFQVLALPYLFDDQKMAWDVMDGEFGQAMADDMAAQTGIHMFGVGDNGVRNFTNNVRPISSPEDMKGLKMRVMVSPVWVALTESLGASATPVSWPELPGALQQGVVDGQENGVTNIVNASLYQHQKYVTLDGHVYSWHAYLMNEGFYQGLGDDERKAVDTCADIAIAIHRGMTAAQDANGTAILSGLGMEVTALSPEQIAAFREATQPAVREYIVGDMGAEWPDRLDAAVKAYREQ